MKTRLIPFALACLLVAAPATAQVNYAVSSGTAYVKEPDLNSTARSVHARGRVEVDGTVISEILPRRP